MAMRTLAIVVALAILPMAGSLPEPAASSATPHSPDPLASSTGEDGLAPLSLWSAGGPRPTDERSLVVVPGGPQDLVVTGQGKPMLLVIGLNHGASLGGTLSAPKACQGDDLSFNVIGASTPGTTLATATCKVLPPGRHTFHLDAGPSAFVGYARLYNATFG